MAVPISLTIKLGATEAEAEAAVALACESRGRVAAKPPSAADLAFAKGVAVEVLKAALDAEKARKAGEAETHVTGLS